MPWTWSSSFFVTIFTRKGPELCKIKDREGREGIGEPCKILKSKT